MPMINKGCGVVRPMLDAGSAVEALLVSRLDRVYNRVRSPPLR